MTEKPLDIAGAQAVIAKHCRRLPSSPVAVDEALGLVLDEAVVAAGDVPGTANSAMDGFAAQPSAAGTRLTIVGESRAGHPSETVVAAGEAVRISTGATMPQGATAVAPIEVVEESDDTVTLVQELTEAANVRMAGEDLRAGDEVLGAGRELGPAEIGIAVAAGRATLNCTRRVRVAIVATGDELRKPGEPLKPGELHDSNLTTLQAMARQAGAEVVSAAHVGDDRDATEAAFAQALKAADVVVCSGGVSVGPHDHVKGALIGLGVEQHFWRVALRPGRPTWFGSREGRLVFGLPGNPVSAMVTFLLFVAPALRALQGRRALESSAAVLGESIGRHPKRDECVRVRVVDREAFATGPQGSHILSSMTLADALAVIPRGEGSLDAGSPIELLALEP
ncbi:MAG: molybdopterin molybdenumtransferase MoeA [Actinobacteria bacterium]|uniref:molybdopterin molybdotransferase n=1 Tax=freshwater metagenome TaxID=449393 RepID=A0A6J5ZXW5_9ZZZZ|nr:molybdopterin molybdenumtransferase MoeA [Actinomycetota bacterium]